MDTASALPLLLFCQLLKVLVFDLSAYPSLLLTESFLDPFDKLLFQVLQLLLVIRFCLLESGREGTLLGLLVVDVLPQLLCLIFHLVRIGSLLDVGVIALLVLSCLVVHLLQPVTLGVWVRSLSGGPVDIVDFGESSLRVFDGSNYFTVLVSCAAESHGHSLSIEPGEHTSENRVDSTQNCKGDARTLLVRRKTS